MHAIITWLSCTWQACGCQRKMITREFFVCSLQRINTHYLSLNINRLSRDKQFLNIRCHITEIRNERNVILLVKITSTTMCRIWTWYTRHSWYNNAQKDGIYPVKVTHLQNKLSLKWSFLPLYCQFHANGVNVSLNLWYIHIRSTVPLGSDSI